MKESAPFKIRCPNCRGAIEFPLYGVGEVVECPHCQSSITLSFPADDTIDSTQQIEAFLGTGSFPRTRAQLLFLKVFTFPTDLRELRGVDVWQQALEEPLDSTVSRFIDVGMLQEGNEDVTTLLQSKSKEELKSLAKARNLPQSGTKQLLAERLFKADPAGMSEFFRGKSYFTCTAKGQLIVETFVESERELMHKAERATESALRSSSYEEACAIVATFEASKVFQRGVGIDWSRYDATRDLEVLTEIATYQSKRHRDIPEPVFRSLRVSAGMMNLWKALEVYHRIRFPGAKKVLRERLEELVRIHAEQLKPIISELASFARLAAETRNHFTHWERSESSIISDDELPAYTDRVRRLLQICILSDLGISNTAVQRIVAEPLPKAIEF